MFRVGRTRRLHPVENQSTLYLEHSKKLMMDAFYEAEQVMIHIGDLNHFHKKPIENTLVYINSVNPSNIVTDSILTDYDFDLKFGDALKARRNVEYCQWVETSTDQTIGEGENQETIRTYHYYKSWQTTRIPSFFFDQPAAHHNPQYDPFPSTSFQVEKVSLYNNNGEKKFDLHKELISAASPLILKKNYPKKDLEGFFNSKAHENVGFRYIGQGYFYYNHEPTFFETFLRASGMGLEGTLLDYQLGDLFSQCNAGDIRVSYTQVSKREGLSIIAGVKSDQGDLNTFLTSKNYEIGFIDSGLISPSEIFRKKIQDQKAILYIAYFILFLWCLPVQIWANRNNGISILVIGAVLIWISSLGGIKLFVYGFKKNLILQILLGIAGWTHLNTLKKNLNENSESNEAESSGNLREEKSE
ncbi:hypothetical protein HK099_003695 [Clydaea vesicula]|uniref:Uncharacterized protein n=1 Tax=Clydaea vesicula TaxID=447962 RepID=A0AAD5U1C3_9FUNG|nr:hypothetical protein HK099_003695 [Clydaea vesicula]